MINWKKVPRERGIYQITTGRVSYVGLSDNIQVRIKQHLESTSCRSRIILDTNKAKIKVLERLPHSDDQTLALREWYWFHKLKRKGHIMVNDPKTLGRTKSGQYVPSKPLHTADSSFMGCRFKLLGITTIVVGFFALGFLATAQLLRQIEWNASQIVTENNSNSQSKPQQDTQSRGIQSANACTTILREESSEQNIQQLQRQLEELGYYEGRIDGIYGENTKEAVRQFQQDHNLQRDGIVGCDTQTIINEVLEES